MTGTKNERASDDGTIYGLPPQEITDAARLVERWFAKRGIKDWTICGVQSRAPASDAPTAGEREPVSTVAEVFVDGKRLYNTTYPSDALDKLPKGTSLYTSPPASELEALRKERDEARAVHRWSVDDLGNGELYVCRDAHDKGEPCEWEAFAPLSRAETAEAEVSRLTALVEEAKGVVGLLQEADFWIEGALNCKSWHWDADQHEAATDSLQRIRAARRVREGGHADV